MRNKLEKMKFHLLTKMKEMKRIQTHRAIEIFLSDQIYFQYAQLKPRKLRIFNKTASWRKIGKKISQENIALEISWKTKLKT